MYNFFFMEFSNFPPGLALRGLQCGMTVKVCDTARSGLDVTLRANFQRCVETLNFNQFSKFRKIWRFDTVTYCGYLL